MSAPTDIFLPTGRAALHPDWPDARFNVSGLFDDHAAVLLHFMQNVQNMLRCRAPVEGVHGGPAMRWNAGRVANASIVPSTVPIMLGHFHAWGIGCLATFTNHRLEESDLRDPTSNFILDCLAQRPDLNGVIVTSDLLSRYIASRYPNLRQIASITKVALEKGAGRIEYYQDLGRRFFRYVIHPDDGRNLKLLEQLDREKTEIIVNEPCVANCPERPRHYDMIAQVQQQVAVGITRQKTVPCMMAYAMKQDAAPRRSCCLSRAEMKAVYDLGFRHFKLQGRAFNLHAFVHDLSRFMLEPDYVATCLFRIYCSLLPDAHQPSQIKWNWTTAKKT